MVDLASAVDTRVVQDFNCGIDWLQICYTVTKFGNFRQKYSQLKQFVGPEMLVVP